LRVIHVGQFLFRAGSNRAEVAHPVADRRRLQILRCVVTSPVNDVRVMREFDVPVEVGGRESVRRAAQDCDVLLVSGPAELAEWLGEIRPKLCVFVAHGDGPWTGHIYDRSARVFDHVIAVSRGVQKAIWQRNSQHRDLQRIGCRPYLTFRVAKRHSTSIRFLRHRLRRRQRAAIFSGKAPRKTHRGDFATPGKIQIVAGGLGPFATAAAGNGE